MENQTICILCGEPPLRQRLEDQLRDHYRLLFPATPQKLVGFLKEQTVACIIVRESHAGWYMPFVGVS